MQSSRTKQEQSIPPKVGGLGGLPCHAGSVTYALLAQLVLATFILLFLTACGSSNQSPPPVNLETLSDELDETDDLSSAVDEFSARLGVDPTAVSVRIQFRGCETCEIRQPPKQPPDISLNKALEQLQPNDKLWLVAPDLTCYYIFDGKTVTPLSCQEEITSKGATP